MSRKFPPDPSGKRHLVMLVNGLWGNPRNFSFILKTFESSDLGRPERGYVFHRSSVNKYLNTAEGIDVCGERLIQEIRGLVTLYPQLEAISFIAHSLGGLIVRFAIGRLFEPSLDGPGGTICGLAPRHFITLATPHLGCSSEAGNEAQVPFIHWWGQTRFVPPKPSVLDRITFPVASGFLQWTGRQLFLVDHLYDHGDRLRALAPAKSADPEAPDASLCKDPLILLLAQDVHSGPYQGLYLSALKSFASRTAIANVSNDRFVGWANGSIRAVADLPAIDPTLRKKAKGIVREDPVEAGMHRFATLYGPHTAAAAAATAAHAPSRDTASPRALEELSTLDLEFEDPSDRDARGDGGLRERLDGRGPKGALRMFAPRAELDRVLVQQRRAIQTVLAALSKVPFRRVDVAFDGSFMPKSAHNHVQVSRVLINFEGKTVIDRLVQIFEESEKHAFV